MPYILRDCDRVLFREAILLGDRLAGMPEATPEVVRKIRLFQALLARLPEVPTIWYGGLDFGVLNLEPDFCGVNRSWYVNYEAKMERCLTVGTIVVTVDHGYRCAEGEDRSAEDWFTFHPDEASKFDPRYYRAWLDAVRDPNQFRNPHQEFEVDAYYETEFPRWARRLRDGS